MMKLTEFLDVMDPQKTDIIQIMKNQGIIEKNQSHIEHFQQLSATQKKYYTEFQTKFDQKRRERWPIVLQEYIKYKEPAVVNGHIISNLQNQYDIEEIYIYIDFLKPGRHDYKIIYSQKEKGLAVNNVCFQGFANVDVRREQIQLTDFHHDRSNIQFQKIDSIFNELEDCNSEKLIQKQMDQDTIKLDGIVEEVKKGLLKSQFIIDVVDDDKKMQYEEQVKSMTDTLRQEISNNYQDLIYLYRLLQSRISDINQYPFLQYEQIYHMFSNAGFLQIYQQHQKRNQNQIIHDCIIIKQNQQFISSICQEACPDSVKYSFDRKQFISIIIRFVIKIADLKEYQGNEQKGNNRKQFYSKVLIDLMQNNINNYIQKIEMFPRYFEQQYLFKDQALTKILQENKLPLLQIFRSQQNKQTRLTLQKKQSSFDFTQTSQHKQQQVWIDQIMNIFNNPNIRKIGVSQSDLMMCYSLSKQPAIKDQQDQYLKMNYVEFMQMIVRISVLKFYSSEQNHLISLAKKVEYLLDDLFECLGIQANDSNRILHKSILDDKHVLIPKSLKLYRNQFSNFQCCMINKNLQKDQRDDQASDNIEEENSDQKKKKKQGDKKIESSSSETSQQSESQDEILIDDELS